MPKWLKSFVLLVKTDATIAVKLLNFKQFKHISFETKNVNRSTRNFPFF